MIIFSLIALILAITVHEFAHAWAADRLGDPTPRLSGRLTLNPIAHLDLFGSLIFLFLFISNSPFVFGWGKPVVFDPFNLRSPRKDAALISIAGPIANLTVAIIGSILLRILFLINPLMMVYSLLITLIQSLILVNIVLAVFNLIPIHPLDGFKIVEGILPKEKAIEWQQLERFGYILLFLLIFPIFGSVAPLNLLISPVLNVLFKILIPSAPLV